MSPSDEKTDQLMPAPKRSLVLAGGGVRLAYHAGVLAALEEEGLYFNHVDGTSGGIFGTAMIASGIGPAEAAARWRKLKLKNFMSVLPLKNYSSPHTLAGMGGSDGIRKKIFPSLGIDVKKINSYKESDVTFNVCNFSKKTIEAIPHQQVTEDHLIAGMSLPIFMPALKIGDDWYTDAVWIKDANLTEAVKRGAEEIWLIWCIGNTSKYLNGSFNQYVHMIEMSASGGLFTEIEYLKKVNAERAGKDLKPIVLHIIKPEYPLPLDPDFFLGKIDANTLINMGYADTRQYLANLRPFDFNLEPSRSINMKDPGTTVHFRQQFNGNIHFANRVRPLNIQLSFYIHQTGQGLILQQFSSVYLQENATVICGYQNRVTAEGRGSLTSSFIFVSNSIKYTVELKMNMGNVYDLIMGLAAKTATVSITENNIARNSEVFHQSGYCRIKNALHLNISSETGWYEKIKLKKRILKLLFEPAVVFTMAG